MQPFEHQQLPIDDIQWDALIPLIGKANRSGKVVLAEQGPTTDNGIKSMTGPRLREAVIQAPVRL